LLSPACHFAKPSCAFWRSRSPPWSQGCPARPPIAAGACAWYKHLDGGFPVQGVRFGGLKSDQFHLLEPWLGPPSPLPRRSSRPGAAACWGLGLGTGARGRGAGARGQRLQAQAGASAPPARPPATSQRRRPGGGGAGGTCGR
jgi:hypothetical protein